MGVRTTRCLTWGETRNEGTVRGRGFIAHFAEIVTMCGRRPRNGDPPIKHELPEDAYRRQRGICRACFAAYSAAHAEVYYPSQSPALPGKETP